MKLEIKNRAELLEALKHHGKLHLKGNTTYHCRWDSERGPLFEFIGEWFEWHIVFTNSDEWHTVESGEEG